MANEKNEKSSKAAEKASDPKKAPASRPASGNQAGRQQAESIGFLLIAAGVLIALNFLGLMSVFFRVDTTANRAFSLSEGSRRVVRELEDRLTVTAYFTSDLPPPFNSTERYVRDILMEYEASGGTNVVVRFVNCDTDEEKQEAERQGVQLVQHQQIQNDSVSVVEGYRGVVFEYLGERQTIAVIQPDTQGLEYEITMAIKRLTGERLPVGILSGHEGPTLTKGLSTLQRMLPTYELTEVSAAEEIPRTLRALLVIDPHNEIPTAELRNIDEFVMHGGSLGVFGGAMSVDVESGPDISGTATNSGINRLLERWGMRMEENIVLDANCGRVPLRTPLGIAIPVLYPPAPVVSLSADQAQHPVLFRLDGFPLFFVSQISTTETFGTLGGTALMTSSEGEPGSWLASGETVSLRIREPREWVSTMGTSERGPFTLAAALEAELPSAFGSEGGMSAEGEGDGESSDGPQRSERAVRVLVVGTSSMLRDEFLPQGQQVADAELAGAMAFPLNAIDWLAQDSDLIAIRAKTIEEPALDIPQGVQDATDAVQEQLEAQDEEGVREALERRTAALEAWERTKAFYRWGNTLLIPLAFAIFGVVRWQMRKAAKASAQR